MAFILQPSLPGHPNDTRSHRRQPESAIQEHLIDPCVSCLAAIFWSYPGRAILLISTRSSGVFWLWRRRWEGRDTRTKHGWWERYMSSVGYGTISKLRFSYGICDVTVTVDMAGFYLNHFNLSPQAFPFNICRTQRWPLTIWYLVFGYLTTGILTLAFLYSVALCLVFWISPKQHFCLTTNVCANVTTAPGHAIWAHSQGLSPRRRLGI